MTSGALDRMSVRFPKSLSMRHLALKPALIIAAVLGVGAAANARAQARRDSSAKPVETGLKVPPYRFRFLPGVRR